METCNEKSNRNSDRWKKNPFGYSDKAFDYKINISETMKTEIVYKALISPEKKMFPPKFKMATYNVWGVEEFTFTFIDIRLPFIIQLLKDLNSDVYCLQEVSKKVLEHLMQDPWISSNYYFSEQSMARVNNADVICLTMTKYCPYTTHIFTLRGGLFASDVIFSVFDDRIIINTNLHPGSKHSPGVSDSSIYACCRIEQIHIIKELIKKINTDNKIVYMCGDFNIDFNGNTHDWPELTHIKTLDLVDTWPQLFESDIKGYTENTVVNEMRWNTKKIDKQVRYDCILYTSTNNVKPITIQIFGNKKIYDLPFDLFLKGIAHLKLDTKKGFKVDGKTVYDNSCIKTVNWFPSDHFGVVAEFEQK